jgi:hypothetical protein
MRKTTAKSLLLALLISLTTEEVAFAYIDPNTGGMLFQVLATALALLSGVALVFSRQIRVISARAMRSLRRMSGRGDPQAQGTHTQSEQEEGQ